MVEIVWSEYCGKCGHNNAYFTHFSYHADYHSFVRVPLNFNEWQKSFNDSLRDALIRMEKEVRDFDGYREKEIYPYSPLCEAEEVIRELLSGLDSEEK